MIDRADEERIQAGLRGGRAERERACADLLALAGPRLFALALRITGRRDLAEDAVQETLVDALRGAPGFRGEARLSTWIYRIAVSAAARIATRGRDAARASELADVADPAREPGDALAQREGAARILAALARLPPAQRAVLALAALEDLPHAEIARVLGIPEGTVHSRLHHARARLRAALEHDA